MVAKSVQCEHDNAGSLVLLLVHLHHAVLLANLLLPLSILVRSSDSPAERSGKDRRHTMPPATVKQVP